MGMHVMAFDQTYETMHTTKQPLPLVYETTPTGLQILFIGIAFGSLLAVSLTL